MVKCRLEQDRANFIVKQQLFGTSMLGAPLFYFPAEIDTPERGLIIAGTHGDETASMMLISSALRTLDTNQLKHDVILSLNPDGNQLSTRANGNGVDLNRAFPTRNWLPDDTVYRWSIESPTRKVTIKTGDNLNLEPEVSGLMSLIAERKPKFVVSFHEPLACIDTEISSPLVDWMSKAYQLPVVGSVGYPTPGSFGTWCTEQQLPCITVELPDISSDAAVKQYLDATLELLNY
ncbi:murein tripeptide amidase MpaA [Vibrio sp. SS-MA-C1-2]|uniref:murein tripeptide amidase MpaA n=1 Tax=Vibrio sp. SS-MA-C1-2 TaxID=2908646 RepID=UPI001F1FE4EB|nr:murein tripeptide amidase MpaA [Vibrio sp. SS-MA-C1-2]UJF18378.1 murein tripeptide amidase MpaA [Vibrio sp. SS-MA-C1-2]